MDFSKWFQIEKIFDKFNIKPMVGIIPANNDPKQMIYPENSEFWNIVSSWHNKRWQIALHGYDHCYITDDAGINPLWNRSEFAGVPLEIQKKKIKEGVAILYNHGIKAKYFFAPSHTFDKNTLVALKECSDIRIISDTIGLNPYIKGDFIFIPQVGGHCYKSLLPGYFTFCFHPSVMNEVDFDNLEIFLKRNYSKCISFEDIDLKNVGRKGLFSRLLSITYFTLRRVRK